MSRCRWVHGQWLGRSLAPSCLVVRHRHRYCEVCGDRGTSGLCSRTACVSRRPPFHKFPHGQHDGDGSCCGFARLRPPTRSHLNLNALHCDWETYRCNALDPAGVAGRLATVAVGPLDWWRDRRQRLDGIGLTHTVSLCAAGDGVHGGGARAPQRWHPPSPGQLCSSG